LAADQEQFAIIGLCWIKLFHILTAVLLLYCFSPIPDIRLKEYDIIIYSLGGAHNLFSLLVLVTYFLSNHPTLPSFSGMMHKLRWVVPIKKCLFIHSGYLYSAPSRNLLRGALSL